MSLCCARCGKASPVRDVEIIEGEHHDVVVVPLARGFYPVLGLLDHGPVTCVACASDAELNWWITSRARREDWGIAEAVAAADVDDG